MAIKVVLAAALLAALVAFAAATSYTTTVTTVAVDEDANPFQRQCSEQVRGREFRACQRYLSQRGSPYEVEEDVIERQRGQGQQGSVQECCNQLRQMDRQGCGCQAIRHAVKQTQQRQGQQGGQSQQVYQRAQQLPQMCDLRDQQCQFPVVFL